MYISELHSQIHRRDVIIDRYCYKIRTSHQAYIWLAYTHVLTKSILSLGENNGDSLLLHIRPPFLKEK